MFYVRTKGQSTLEYVILLGFVVAALIAMGVYMRRGAEGQLREATDRVGGQYEARNTESKYTTISHLEQTQNDAVGGGSVITIGSNTDNFTTKTGGETVHTWTK